jgi:hypothetical protein
MPQEILPVFVYVMYNKNILITIGKKIFKNAIHNLCYGVAIVSTFLHTELVMLYSLNIKTTQKFSRLLQHSISALQGRVKRCVLISNVSVVNTVLCCRRQVAPK